MNIIGLDALHFAVDDIAGCTQYLLDYGLIDAGGGRFEAIDGTAIVIADENDPTLPAPPNAGCRLRRTVMGVAARADLDAIAAELGRDREVRALPDGSIESVDDEGFVIAFQLSVRRPFEKAGEIANAPGSPFLRRVNQLGVNAHSPQIRPRSLSHVVYFVADPVKAEAFYVQRLGFRCTDRFTGVGPFLQPQGTQDHHTHFFIGAPAFMKGCEHFTFHFAGPSEVMQNGARFVEKGYQPFWGPGRHQMGSNWFWYFNSPFGCHMEMDADMDLHDASWQPREMAVGAEASQAFLLGYRQKWAPGPDTQENGAYA
ncbi:VOC family protein [Hydrogenophaga pseudoflava]|uniref:VOC family protein n=1 Tax=Hydrogenophaga pseudoflava TaxID=47421 RepID=UPI0027E5188A|nr:VOC family protein [Hydrogenophaga pseudoflava]MDQ7746035.1 VOC family protein [Hydrogenophaga pseudoflava]